jgi:DNA-binding GntR family transcriptional regulator
MFNKLSLSEQVEDALRREITEGRKLPGERVSIADYQDSWNVSSTPFRDAIRSLEMQGFVKVEPRKGVYVAPMNVETIVEIFDLRIGLECIAIELATKRVPQEIAETSRGAYLELKSVLETENPEALGSRDRLVHDLGREHCGNRRLQRLLLGQMDLFRWAQNAIIQNLPHSYEIALPEHLAIMDAVCKRDEKGAAAAMRAHLENSRERLLARLENVNPASPKSQK